jgi:hypothetical protein
MKSSPSCFAFIWTTRTLAFDFASNGAADSNMAIPETDIAGFRASNVYFDLNLVSDGTY